MKVYWYTFENKRSGYIPYVKNGTICVIPNEFNTDKINTPIVEYQLDYNKKIEFKKSNPTYYEPILDIDIPGKVLDYGVPSDDMMLVVLRIDKSAYTLIAMDLNKSDDREGEPSSLNKITTNNASYELLGFDRSFTSQYCVLILKNKILNCIEYWQIEFENDDNLICTNRVDKDALSALKEWERDLL